jgi:hypothetical protein
MTTTHQDTATQAAEALKRAFCIERLVDDPEYPGEDEWVIADKEEIASILRPFMETKEDSVSTKLRMIEFIQPVLRHIEVTKQIFQAQADAKNAALSGDGDDHHKFWCEGYASALQEAVKQLDHILREETQTIVDFAKPLKNLMNDLLEESKRKDEEIARLQGEIASLQIRNHEDSLGMEPL